MKLTVILSLALFVSGVAGCSTESMFRSSSEAKRAEAKLKSEESDSWVSDAGDYTRKVHPKDEIKDPLHLREVFTSEKSREIERNLGVGP